MPTNRVRVNLDSLMVEAAEDFRIRHGFGSMGEAVAAMMRVVLTTEQHGQVRYRFDLKTGMIEFDVLSDKPPEPPASPPVPVQKIPHAIELLKIRKMQGQG